MTATRLLLVERSSLAGSRTADGAPEGGTAAVPFHQTQGARHDAGGTCTSQRRARTYLTHFVGDGLEDDRYVIQRYLSQANGDIVPIDADGTKSKGRRRPTGLSCDEVEIVHDAPITARLTGWG